jgi:predicted nucleic acid-binding protein
MEPIFLDTNILVYVLQSESVFHSQARERLTELTGIGNTFVVSNQVIREVMTTLTHPRTISPNLSQNEIVSALKGFRDHYLILHESQQSFELLLALVERYQLRGKIVHDANIVAVMLANGVSKILTNNGADFERFGDNGIEVIPLSQSA